MSGYLQPSELLSGEEILGAIPYRPFSVLTLTNKRIIGKSLFRIGLKRFEGSIDLENVSGVEFASGVPFLTTPSLVISYVGPDGAGQRAVIRFPGLSARLAGFNPAAMYRMIEAQLSTLHRNPEP